MYNPNIQTVIFCSLFLLAHSMLQNSTEVYDKIKLGKHINIFS